MDRRDFFTAAVAFAALGSLTAHAQDSSTDTADMTLSHVFRFGDMHRTENTNGGWGRAVLHGTLPTGEFVELHETMLPPGQMPHPPHKHRNSEFILLREGSLEYLNEGSPEPVVPGDVIYTASNRMHGLLNKGQTPALYYVVSISHGQL